MIFKVWEGDFCGIFYYITYDMLHEALCPDGCSVSDFAFGKRREWKYDRLPSKEC